ncbi:MAG: fumarylacetoacetate hydrolase family protein [Pseudomonadota bacterium]
MKFLRYGPVGEEKPGILDQQGNVRDVSAHVSDWSSDALDPSHLATFDQAKIEACPPVEGAPRLGPCIAGTRNFIAIGLNYADHAEEAGMHTPAEPVMFSKAPSSIAGPTDDLVYPKGATKLDWEVELAIIIGKAAYQVDEKMALDHVAGFCICNDISERAWQLEGTGQWVKGKSAPGFGPLGPWFTPPSHIPALNDLDLSLKVNGEVKQKGSTKTILFPPAFLVSYVSRFLQLEPGDIITTGTPAGVGMGMKPPQFLQEGDVIEAAITGLGHQKTRVV